MLDAWEKEPGMFLDLSHRGGVKPKRDGQPLSPYFWAAFVLAGDWK
jgi:hypothetical protein